MDYGESMQPERFAKCGQVPDPYVYSGAGQDTMQYYSILQQIYCNKQEKNFAHEIPTIDIKTAQLLLEAHRKQKTEEKSRYLEKATKRDKIIALLKKQREERIKKELISIPYKPKIAVQDPCRQARKEYEDEALETMKALKEFD